MSNKTKKNMEKKKQKKNTHTLSEQLQNMIGKW